jgi:filamentous hemagglutinin family protein
LARNFENPMKFFFENLKKLWLAALIFSVARAANVFANPTGLTVSSGSATTQQTGSQLNVTVSQLAILNWSSFNIAAGETTSFLQPSSSSIVFNLIGGASPSQIFGSLNANGTVILENANGFYFGSGSMIKVGGSFIATTAATPPDFGSGAGWQFTGMPPLASIVNYGQIQVGSGKSLFLIAENIENHGSLNAPGGSVDLAAGQSVLVSDSPDGRGLSAVVQMPAGSVDNFGRITADGGSIVLQAKVVNQDGILQANSVAEKNGVIELVASDELNLGVNSQILARGDDSAGGSSGGTVTLKSDNIFSDADGSQIVTTGGANGGNGGNIEVSAPNIQSLNSAMDAGAQSGFVGGVFSLDPVNIILGTSGSGMVTAGTVGYSSSGTDAFGDLFLNVNTAFANVNNFSQILLQASGNIYVGNGTVNSSGRFTFASGPAVTWNLSSSTGQNSGQLTLEAGASIYFGNRSLITDANSWSVTLAAGYNFNSQSVQAGSGPVYTGSIYLGDVTRNSSGIQGTDANGNFIPSNGSGSIQLASGNINLTAGGAVAVGTGSMLTTAGGNIDVTALSGDIIAGTKTSGVQNSGYADDNFGNWNVSSSLGGISTMAGGSVTLDAVAGSINPSSRTTIFGVSGAFGSEPGNVTLIAGNGIFGTFNVANGVGTMLAGVTVAGDTPAIQNSGANIGSVTAPVSLQLASGSWNVWAGNNIYIGEVRNPSGTFDGSDSFPFNYSPTAAANFWAGNGITLQGQNQPRTSDNSTMPPIYAPQLSLSAGAGGITINNPIILFPSSAGSLFIKTTGGGDLVAVKYDDSNPLPPGITMSDSSSGDWTTFASGQAATPLHLNDQNPVTLDISGSIYGLILNVPTFASITVGGSTYNFGFNGQNLSASQTTSINVAGDIVYSSALHQASVPLTDLLPAELFSSTLSGNPKVAGELSYNAATGTLTFKGQMQVSDLTFLLNPTVVELNASGQPVLDANGNLVLVPVTLDAAQRAAMLALYVDSQAANGLALAGSGSFDISARNIALGISDGVTVDFPNAPSATLTAISPNGASLNVTMSGNLDLTASKIANGGVAGGIDLTVGGALDVGGTATALGDASAPKGIFTTSGGDITVNAGGNVNVDGSRIAAYNGGNISITSQNGDVNAGAGGEGFVIFNALQLDPATGQLIVIPSDIPLSGILATTVFGSDAALGNITINAPNGSINSSLGGVLQIAFNTADTANNFIDVTAGKDINATGSGIIGYNVKLQAGGNINGVVVGSQSVAVSSLQNVDVTAVSGGNVNISASGSVSGTVIGGGDVSVSGSSIDAAVRGGSVSTSGDTSGASLGVPAAGPQENAQVADNANTATTKTDSGEDTDPLKKKKGIALAQKVSRVTVLLPGKN